MRRDRGYTYVELIAVAAMLLILAAAVIPLSYTIVKKKREIRLMEALRTIRTAIDEYKKIADQKKIKMEDPEKTMGYPPNLEILVEGAELADGSGKRIKFLRRIPLDPMTNSYDWGLISYQDEPDSEIWGGENVYDVYTKSPEVGLNGIPYKKW